MLTCWIEEYKKTDTYHWIIILKSISQAIGYIYFADIDDTNNSVSVHYALSRKYWKQGIMSEACKRVIDFAFNVLGAEKVHTTHHLENPASGKVMQKCGMTFEGRIRGGSLFDGEICDCVQYSILQSDILQ